MITFKLPNCGVGASLADSGDSRRREANVVVLAPCEEHWLLNDVIFFRNLYRKRK